MEHDGSTGRRPGETSIHLTLATVSRHASRSRFLSCLESSINPENDRFDDKIFPQRTASPPSCSSQHNKAQQGHQAADYPAHLSPSSCAPAPHDTHLDFIISLIIFPISVTPLVLSSGVIDTVFMSVRCLCYVFIV